MNYGPDLIINGQDFSGILLKYAVKHVPEYELEIKTIDKRMHSYGDAERTYIKFSTMPRPDGEQEDARALRQKPLMVTFRDTEYGTVRRMEFRRTSDLQADYLLRNIFGDDIYAHAEIILEAVEVDNADNIRNVSQNSG